VRGVLWETDMKVYNATSLPIVVRAFAAKIITEPNQFVMIDPGQSEDFFGPVLARYGFMGPYLLMGDALVRDWGPLKITPDQKMPEMVLRPKMAGTYKQPFALDPQLFEGFFCRFLQRSPTHWSLTSDFVTKPQSIWTAVFF